MPWALDVGNPRGVSFNQPQKRSAQFDAEPFDIALERLLLSLGMRHVIKFEVVVIEPVEADAAWNGRFAPSPISSGANILQTSVASEPFNLKEAVFKINRLPASDVAAVNQFVGLSEEISASCPVHSQANSGGGIEIQFHIGSKV